MSLYSASHSAQQSEAFPVYQLHLLRPDKLPTRFLSIDYSLLI